MASTKQMIVRMNDGHFNALKAVRDDKMLVNAATPISTVMGYRTVLRTLAKWGAIDNNGLTETGKELIQGWLKRFPNAKE